MKLEDQVISLELAKRMKELGFKQESIFSWYYIDVPLLYSGPEIGYFGSNLPSDASEIYAAYTVAELGEMLPEGIISIRPLTKNEWDFKPEDRWLVADACPYIEREYLCMSDGFIDTSLHSENWANTEVDARAKMLIYLAEKQIINPSQGV